MTNRRVSVPLSSLLLPFPSPSVYLHIHLLFFHSPPPLFVPPSPSPPSPHPTPSSSHSSPSPSLSPPIPSPPLPHPTPPPPHPLPPLPPRPIHDAVEANDLAGVKLLVEYGASIAPESGERLPLEIAKSKGFLSIVEYLQGLCMHVCACM